MPEIEQYDWSKLKPHTPERNNRRGTKSFATHEIIEARPGSKNGDVHITRPPKRKPTKIKDKRLFNDIYDQDQHLRNIPS